MSDLPKTPAEWADWAYTQTCTGGDGLKAVTEALTEYGKQSFEAGMERGVTMHIVREKAAEMLEELDTVPDVPRKSLETIKMPIRYFLDEPDNFNPQTMEILSKGAVEEIDRLLSIQ